MLLCLKMGHQIVIACEALVAQSTHVWLLTGMCLIVHLEHTGICECLATSVANIRSLIAMHSKG